MADGSDETPRTDASEVIKRLRSDVRDAVDVAVDVLSNALGSLGVERAGLPAAKLESGVLADLAPRGVSGGEEVSVHVHLNNDSDEATEPFELSAADLVSHDGARIPASAVEVARESRVVAGKSSDLVTVKVAVPADAKPGRYSGQLQATNGATGPAEVAVEVV